jgi:hypothetical protein
MTGPVRKGYLLRAVTSEETLQAAEAEGAQVQVFEIERLDLPFYAPSRAATSAWT